MQHLGCAAFHLLGDSGILKAERQVGNMKQKFNQYRPVWVTLLVTLVLAWLVWLPSYHIPGTAASFAKQALHYSGSSDGKLPEVGEVVQQQEIAGRMVVMFRRTDGSPEFGAVVFSRGWNGLWRPVNSSTSGRYPLDAVSLSNEDYKRIAVFSVGYPEEAVYWGIETDPHVMQSVADPENLQPLPSPPFIHAFTLSDGAVGGRFVLYDAQGRELPETLTGTPGGGGTRTYDGVTPVACVLVLLVGAVVALVRFVRLRRKAQTLRQEADGA